MTDILKRFIAEDGSFRAVVVETTRTGQEAFRRKSISPIALQLLTQALTGACLLSSSFKEESVLMLHLSGKGPVGQIAAEARTNGDLRGYLGEPSLDFDRAEGGTLLGTALGSEALLKVTRRTKGKEFPGIVQVVPGEMAINLANYLQISEQIQSGIVLGAKLDAELGVKGAGGVLIQAMPGADEHLLFILEDRLGHLPQMGDIFAEQDGHIRIEKILFEGMPLRLLEERTVRFHCSCSKDRVLAMIANWPEQERASLLDQDGAFSITCAFCDQTHICNAVDLAGAMENNRNA